MPTRSKVYRVMIGSPSDLAEEREVATDAVNDWNVQNADGEGAALLPVKWETHAMPTSSVRPQSVINDRLVDRTSTLLPLAHSRCRSRCGLNTAWRSAAAFYAASFP